MLHNLSQETLRPLAQLDMHVASDVETPSIKWHPPTSQQVKKNTISPIPSTSLSHTHTEDINKYKHVFKKNQQEPSP